MCLHAVHGGRETWHVSERNGVLGVKLDSFKFTALQGFVIYMGDSLTLVEYRVLCKKLSSQTHFSIMHHSFVLQRPAGFKVQQNEFTQIEVKYNIMQDILTRINKMFNSLKCSMIICSIWCCIMEIMNIISGYIYLNWATNSAHPWVDQKLTIFIFLTAMFNHFYS